MKKGIASTDSNHGPGAMRRFRANWDRVFGPKQGPVEMAVLHRIECHWENYCEPAPGVSFWGQLEYKWCQKFCVRAPASPGEREDENGKNSEGSD